VARYQRLYDEHISVGYRYLLENDFERAKATYIGMVLSLSAEWGIGLSVNHAAQAATLARETGNK